VDAHSVGCRVMERRLKAAFCSSSKQRFAVPVLVKPGSYVQTPVLRWWWWMEWGGGVDGSGWDR